MAPMTTARLKDPGPELLELYVVTQFADDGVNSTGYLWALLIQSARQAGYQIQVITPRSNFPSWVPKLIAKLTVTLQLLFTCWWCLPRHSTVLCATNPAFLPLVMPLLRWIKQLKTFFLIHDVFPQNIPVAGLMNEKSLSYLILEELFRWAYRRCEGLIVIGRDMEKVLQGLVGREVPLLYVANWVPVVTTPERKSTLSPLHHFQYFGNLGALQGLNVVLDGIANSQALNARFDFVGTGSAKAAIVAHPILSQDSRVTLHPSVDFAERGRVLSACDVSLVTLRSGMYGLAVPSKAYFSLAHGTPFIFVGDVGSELHLTLEEYPALGWFVPAGDPKMLAKQIDSICLGLPNSELPLQAKQLLEKLHPDEALRKILAFIDR